MVTFRYRNTIMSYFSGYQQHYSIRVSFKRLTKQYDENAISIKDFRQMMKDRIIPDKEEFAKINTIDNTTNALRRSKDKAMAANRNDDISPNRY